jgi:hypothetical protein
LPRFAVAAPPERSEAGVVRGLAGERPGGRASAAEVRVVEQRSDAGRGLRAWRRDAGDDLAGQVHGPAAEVGG